MKNSQLVVKKCNESSNTKLLLKGHLTSINAISFKEELLEVIDSERSDCHLDISGIEALDLTGVNALAVANRKIKSIGKKFVIISSASSPAEELLHLTKFVDVFTFKRA